MAASPLENRQSMPPEQLRNQYHQGPPEQNHSLEHQQTSQQSNYPHPSTAGQHPYHNPSYNTTSGTGDSLEIPRTNLHRNLLNPASSAEKMARDSNPQAPRNGGSDSNDMYNNYSSSGSPHMHNSQPINSNGGGGGHQQQQAAPRPSSNPPAVPSAGRNASLMAKYQNDEPSDNSASGSLGSLMGMFNQFTSKTNMNKTNENLNQITKILADASGEPPVDFRNSFNQSSRIIGQSSVERTSSPKISGPGQAIPGTGHESMAASKRAMYGGSGPTPAANGERGGGQSAKKKRKNTPSAAQSVPDGRDAPPGPGGPSPAGMMGMGGMGGMPGMPGMPQMTPQMMAQYAQQYAAAMPPAMRDVYMQQYQQYQAAMQQYGAHMQGAGTQGKS